MRPLFLIPLILLACPPALAEDGCTHSSPRQLSLDTAGVRVVRVETHQHEVQLRATPGQRHLLSGRACAGKAAWLQDLTLTQARQGDTLVVRLQRENPAGLASLWGDNHAYIEVSGSVPDGVLVQLVVGSGEASLEGAASASADVGSGEARLAGIGGAVTAKVGSGDVEVKGAHSLNVLAIGSGDVKAGDIRGRVRVGSIGSGDFILDGAAGGVEIGSIGSGDADLKKVAGAVRVGSIGSGDLEVDGAASLAIESIGSGSASHRGVAGTIALPATR